MGRYAADAGEVGRGIGSGWRVIAAVVAAIFIGAGGQASAQGRAGATPATDFWTFPDGAVAFFALDPRELGTGAGSDRNLALVELGLRELLANVGSVEGGGSAVPARLIRQEVHGANPIRVCLMELAGSTVEGTGGGRGLADRPVRIERLTAVLEVRAPGPHEALVEAVRAALTEDQAARGALAGTETSITLAGELKGTSFTRSGDPEWRDVSWASKQDVFLVGLGRGALAKWLAAPAPATAPASVAAHEWVAHRAGVVKRRAQTMPVLEACVDLSALRRAVPEEFAFGRMGRLVKGWSIANGRMLVVGVRAPAKSKPKANEPGAAPSAGAAPLLLVDVSYSSRAEPPGATRSIPLTDGAWPGETPLAPPPADAAYALLFRADWRVWLEAAQETWIACSARAGAEQLVARNRWMRPHAKALERLLGRAGMHVLVCAPGKDRPVLSAAISPSSVAAPEDRFEPDQREVFGSISGDLKLEAGVWVLRAGGEPVFGWMAGKGERVLRGDWDPTGLKPGGR